MWLVCSQGETIRGKGSEGGLAKNFLVFSEKKIDSLSLKLNFSSSLKGGGGGGG